MFSANAPNTILRMANNKNLNSQLFHFTCTSLLANGITCKSRSLTLQNNCWVTVPENLPVSNITTSCCCRLSTFAKLLHACQLLQNFCTRIKTSPGPCIWAQRFSAADSAGFYILNLQLTAIDKIGHIIQDGINERIIELLTKRIESKVSQFLQNSW